MLAIYLHLLIISLVSANQSDLPPTSHIGTMKKFLWLFLPQLKDKGGIDLSLSDFQFLKPGNPQQPNGMFCLCSFVLQLLHYYLCDFPFQYIPQLTTVAFMS